VACSTSSPCTGGCCQIPNGSTSGACAVGTNSSACGGTGGACFDCSVSVDGHRCLSGVICGCQSNADCSNGRMCDQSIGKCVQ
jgi:hypothetical protein